MKQYFQIFFLLFSIITFGQVKFETKVGKNSVAQNEILRVEFIMNADGDNFEPPTFEGFKVVGGPSQQVSQSWINGKTSFNKSFIYFLMANKQGKLTIKPATIEINNQTYKTEPITVTITKAVPQQQQPRNPYDPYQQQPQIVTSADGKIHLVAEVSNSNPYLNEPITVVYKLYIHPNIGVSNWIESEKPKYNGFWNNNFEIKNLKVEKGRYNGEEYIFAVLKKTVLYPQKSGKLEIEALGLELNIEVPTGRRDFFGNYQTVQAVKKVSTGTKIINVKPLPPNAPEGFTGAVGKFSMAVKSNKNSLKQLESLDLDVVVSGTGNLKLFNLPKPNLPATFEVYDPVNKQNIETPLAGMTGNIKDTYTIIPQEDGDYTINPLVFSYFDVETKTYKTLTSEPIAVKVLVDETLAKEEPKENKNQNKLLPKEFQNIQLKTKLVSTNKSDFYGSKLFWFLLILPFIIIPLIILLDKKRKDKNLDVIGNRLKNNNKLAKKYLSEAKKYLNNKEPFYIALEKCLHNFLKAKLKIETSEMSKENISQIMQDKKAQESTILELIKLLDSCEFARYAFQSQANIAEDYEKAVTIIAQLDKEII